MVVVDEVFVCWYCSLFVVVVGCVGVDIGVLVVLLVVVLAAFCVCVCVAVVALVVPLVAASNAVRAREILGKFFL